jgi:hypothetical protein
MEALGQSRNLDPSFFERHLQHLGYKGGYVYDVLDPLPSAYNQGTHFSVRFKRDFRPDWSVDLGRRKLRCVWRDERSLLDCHYSDERVTFDIHQESPK